MFKTKMSVCNILDCVFYKYLFHYFEQCAAAVNSVSHVKFNNFDLIIALSVRFIGGLRSTLWAIKKLPNKTRQLRILSQGNGCIPRGSIPAAFSTSIFPELSRDRAKFPYPYWHLNFLDTLFIFKLAQTPPFLSSFQVHPFMNKMLVFTI